MNILVTGSNGQLGRELARVAAASGDRYVLTDIAELDITDRQAVLARVKAEQIEVIVNCAAYTEVDRAEEAEAVADRINHLAVGSLAEAAGAVDATLIHISTDYVFNGKYYLPYTENDTADPQGAYARTKRAGEEAIIGSSCRYIILRTGWLYSRWGNNFLKTMLKLTRERETLGVVFDQVGTPTFAGDLAEAIGQLIDRRMTDRTGIYHFSNEGVCSWYDFAVAIARLAGHRCDIRPIHTAEYPCRAARPPYAVLDKTKFRETFGLRIPHWAESLENCLMQMKTQDNGL
jgi:dTDP-4-dehydrorhamnose reductase